MHLAKPFSFFHEFDKVSHSLNDVKNGYKRVLTSKLINPNITKAPPFMAVSKKLLVKLIIKVKTALVTTAADIPLLVMISAM